MKYSILRGIKKGVISFVIFSIPFLVTQFPDIVNVALGALGMMLINFLRVKYRNKDKYK